MVTLFLSLQCYPFFSLSRSHDLVVSTVTNNRFMFTGREYASTFSIYEYRARAYHPGLGRFTSEDPMGFAAGDYNVFRYCHNDPLDLTDPMGLDTLAAERLKLFHWRMNAGAIAIGR